MHIRTRQILFLILNQYLRRLIVSSLGSFSEDTPVVTQERRSPDSFAAASSQQIRVCSRHSTCSKENTFFNSTCCGSCTCERNCLTYGSCCLDLFENFEYARDSIQHSWFGCVSTQYLTSENTDFNTDKAVWMLTKCPSIYNDIAIIKKCEHPDELLESVVPVTATGSSLLYKNKNCAYCHWLPRDKPLIYWKLLILSNQALSFPHDNLTHVIRETRGNIFFIQPEFIATQPCTPVPDNLIETCNETGLWTEYNADIKTACESFTDPFNYTYKNYFCYMCNTAAATVNSPDNWTCPIKEQGGSIKSPEFSAVVDLQSVVSRQDEETMDCDSTQYPDMIRMTCRDVLCHEDRQLTNGICRPVETKFSDTCISVFIRLGPISSEVFQVDKIVLADSVRTEFTTGRMHEHSLAEKDKRSTESLRNETQSFLFFYNTNEVGDYYIIVYIQTVIRSSIMKDEFLENLMKYTTNMGVINEDRENLLKIYRELAIYNSSVSGENMKIYVPVEDTKLVDELVPDASSSDTMICRHSDTVQLNALRFCPHVILDAHEFSWEVQNEYLVFFERNNEETLRLTSLSKWWYEIHDDKVHICLKDYFRVYHSVAAPEPPGPVVFSKAADYKLLLSFDLLSLLLFTVLLYVST